MLRSLGRAIVVCIGLFVLLIAAQQATERLARKKVIFRLAAAGQMADGKSVAWTLSVTDEGMMDIDGRPVRSLSVVLDRIYQPGLTIELEAEATTDGEKTWTFRRVRDGPTTIDGKPATRADLEKLLQEYVLNESLATKPVTVQDVMAAYKRGEVCIPQRTKVSFPGRLTYKQAYPEAADEPEYVISEFHEAPTIRDKNLREELEIEKFLSQRFCEADDWDHLPPVEERLPVNPLVCEGPDGIGKYGRTKETATWSRCTVQDWSITRKIGYPSFLRFDPVGNLEPHFAYKWTVEDNNRVFTFWLRRGHKWSDGHPWTANDIAFVCNVVIGSKYWPDAANWMQQTDGSIVLYPDDILDWAGLAAQIRKEATLPGAAPGKQVMKAMADEMPSVLRRLVAEEKLDPSKVDGIAADLHRLESEGVTLRQLTKDDLAKTLSSHGLSEGNLIDLATALGRMKLHTLKGLLQGISPDNLPDEYTRIEIVNLLNKLFEIETFYDKEAWKDIDLTSEPAQLMAKGPARLSEEETQRLEFLTTRNDLVRRVNEDPEGRPTGDIDMKKESALLKKMNLLLFRAAYPTFVAKAVRKRVKVEAVADPDIPDEDPALRHIIRFTFEKPNSIFLEKTATFMYYRGLFSIARHHFGRFHPAGPDDSGRLMPLDILEWDDFLEEVCDEAAASEPSPGKQLWSLMSEDFRAKFAAGLPDKDVEAFKESVIGEINRVLQSPEFFTEEAWKSVDLDSKLKEYREEGYTRLVDARDKRRYMELLVLEDWRRYDAASMTPQEIFTRNQVMFRAAFAKDELVGANREEALDTLAQRHENEYLDWFQHLASFGTKLRDEDHHPTLCPWRIVSDPEEITTYAIRNPYYFMVDTQGNQLPYLDVMKTLKQSEKSVRMNKLLSRGGGVNFQCRDLTFDDFTVLKQNEKAGDYKIYLWGNDYCGELQFYFPQTHLDAEYARLQEDPRFRYAMSYALNRQELIDVVYRGMGEPAQWSTPKGSPYYNEKLATAAVEYDPRKANELLDAMGLDKRAKDGTRLFWSGKRIIMDVNTLPERPPAAIQMACNYWQAIGIDARMKVRQGKLMTQLPAMGICDIGVHKEGGNYFGPILAGGYAPTHPAECAWMQKWAQWLRSAGQTGWEPPERIKLLDVMWSRVVQAPTEKAKLAAWQKLSDHTAEQLPQIAIMTSPGQPVYVRNGFKNVNRYSLAGWMAHEPGNNCPEVFYVDPDNQ